MGAPLDLRALLTLVAVSVLCAALASRIYRRDPHRRKLLLAMLGVVLLVVPWWSFAGFWTFPVGVEQPSRWSLAEPAPWALIGLWWLVAAALIARTLARVVHGRRSLDHLPRLQHPATEMQATKVAAQVGFRAPFELRVGPAPCASSLGTATLVLPAAAVQWPSAVRTAVLAHEFAHLRRLDDRLLLAMRLLADWYWWLPWLRRLHLRYGEAMEESCDDLASRALPNREDYVAGVVHAARSLRGAQGSITDSDAWPGWVALLGHSHLAQRAERLLEPPSATLDHADGRWTLLWSGLCVAVLVTAQPAATPQILPGGHRAMPLSLLGAASAADADIVRFPQVDLRTQVRTADSGTWRTLPSSARDPLPIYPDQAMAQGLEGTVTVEFGVESSSGRGHRLSPPSFSSSDPTGTLAAAVARALEHASGDDLAAALRAVSTDDIRMTTPPPGIRLRLRKEYRFVLRVDAGPSDPGG